MKQKKHTVNEKKSSAIIKQQYCVCLYVFEWRLCITINVYTFKRIELFFGIQDSLDLSYTVL